MECRGCSSSNIYQDNEFICNDCGLIQSSIFSTYQKCDEKVSYNKNFKNPNWLIYTSKEKSDYNLNKSTEEICFALKIPECLKSSVCNLVIYVMNAIKKNDSSKRSSVKDGIILVCIKYICKINDSFYSYSNLAKRLNINMKYITRAEKLITELIHSGKIVLHDFDKINIIKPYDYVVSIIKINKIEISDELFSIIEKTINKCIENKILLNYSPLSIGACGCYYVLKNNNIDINLNDFAKLFDTSIITITKIYNVMLTNSI